MLMGMLFVYGAPWRHFVWMLLAGAVTLALMFSILPGVGMQVLQSYQVDRIDGLPAPRPARSAAERLPPERVDRRGRRTAASAAPASRTRTQTLLGYLPEHATDFVFAVVGEERGFVGAAWLIALYALLLWRGLKVITKSRSTFGSLVAAGVVSMLLFQIFINIGMTIGLAPITGIPLPFMSFGGSHTLTNLLAIGVLQAIHVHAQSADEPRLAVA